MTPITTVEVGTANAERARRGARGGLVVFGPNELFEYSRELRLRYLADAVKGRAYPVTATDVADSMLRILGHD